MTEDARPARRAAAIHTRIRETLILHAGDLENDGLTAVTIVVKIDRKTGDIGALLWRPEYETIYPARAGRAMKAPGPEVSGPTSPLPIPAEALAKLLAQS